MNTDGNVNHTGITCSFSVFCHCFPLSLNWEGFVVIWCHGSYFISGVMTRIVICLENSMGRGAWQATVHSFAQSLIRLKWLGMHTHTHTHILSCFLVLSFICNVCHKNICTKYLPARWVNGLLLHTFGMLAWFSIFVRSCRSRILEFQDHYDQRSWITRRQGEWDMEEERAKIYWAFTISGSLHMYFPSIIRHVLGGGC